MKIRALAASTAIALASPLAAQPIDPVAPTSTYGVYIAVGNAAAGEERIEVGVAWASDFEDDEPMIGLQSAAIFGGKTVLTLDEATAMSERLRIIAEAADAGELEKRLLPEARGEMEAKREGASVTIDIRLKPRTGALIELRTMTCTIDEAFALARVLRRAAGNAAWLKERIDALKP